MKEEVKKALEVIKAEKEDSELQTELLSLVPEAKPEDMFAKLEKDETGKTLLNSFADKRVTDGVKTALDKFKKKDMQEAISTAVSEKEKELTKKFNPELSAEAKRLQEMEEEVAKLKKDNAFKDSKEAVTKLLLEKNVDVSFAEHFVSIDLDTSIEKASKFVEKYKQAVTTDSEKVIKQKFKEFEFNPDKSKKNLEKGKVTKAMVEEAKLKAEKVGTNEARGDYSLLKKQYEAQQQET